MRKYLLLVAVSIATLSCNKERISGHGPVKTENRQVSGFNQIVVNASTNVFINYDSLYSVKVKAYSNLIPYLETIVNNNVLTIGYKDKTTIKHDNSEAFISLPQLTSVRTNGSGEINANGIFANQKFEAQTHGSGDITLPEGTTNELSIVSMGSGNVNGFSFEAKSVEVTIMGSANVKVYCTESLKVTINGSGNVYYIGNPTNITTDITGSGHLIKQ